MNNYWNGIYGQETVKQILTRIILSKKIPHALLFNGLDGVGKDFIALRLNQLLNSQIENEPGFSANSTVNLSEPYVKYIFPLPRGKNENDNSGPTEKLSLDEIQLVQEEIQKKNLNPYYKISIPKATNIKINSIRDIKKFLSLDYSEIRHRMILISNAHLMNEESQNALLKSLEEPPEGVIIILTTPYPALLRETIRSRCWNLNFQPLSYSEIEKILTNYFEVDPNLARKISVFAGGSITNALKLIDNNFEMLLDKTIFILRYSFGRKFHSALDQFSEIISGNDADSFQLLIQMIIIWLNDLLKYKLQTDDYYFADYIETIEKFTKRFPDVRLNNIVYKIERLSSAVKNNVNINLLVLNLVYELSALTFPL